MHNTLIFMFSAYLEYRGVSHAVIHTSSVTQREATGLCTDIFYGRIFDDNDALDCLVEKLAVYFSSYKEMYVGGRTSASTDDGATEMEEEGKERNHCHIV